MACVVTGHYVLFYDGRFLTHRGQRRCAVGLGRITWRVSSFLCSSRTKQDRRYVFFVFVRSTRCPIRTMYFAVQPCYSGGVQRGFVCVCFTHITGCYMFPGVSSLAFHYSRCCMKTAISYRRCVQRRACWTRRRFCLFSSHLGCLLGGQVDGAICLDVSCAALQLLCPGCFSLGSTSSEIDIL